MFPRIAKMFLFCADGKMFAANILVLTFHKVANHIRAHHSQSDSSDLHSLVFYCLPILGRVELSSRWFRSQAI